MGYSHSSKQLRIITSIIDTLEVALKKCHEDSELLMMRGGKIPIFYAEEGQIGTIEQVDDNEGMWQYVPCDGKDKQ